MYEIGLTKSAIWLSGKVIGMSIASIVISDCVWGCIDSNLGITNQLHLLNLL